MKLVNGLLSCQDCEERLVCELDSNNSVKLVCPNCDFPKTKSLDW